ncbi:MAG: DUF58 domain-containing protein, partial [Pseudonocardiaceae bacterium]
SKEAAGMRVTRRGIGLILGGITLIVCGLWFGYDELTVVGVAALLAVLGALAFALRRWTLDVHRDVEPDRVTRGQECLGLVSVRNHARWRGVDLIAFDRCGDMTVMVPVLRLGPTKVTAVQYPLPTRKRGVVTVGPLRIERRDPLDIIRISREYGGTRQVWVHPAPQQLRTVPVGRARSLDGAVDQVEHGSITFHALREYVPGDDLRHVHWRTAARVGQLMVREHVDTSLPRVVVLLDNRRASYPDPDFFEYAADAAASVVIAALRAGLNVSLQISSGQLVSGTEASLGARAFLDIFAESDLTDERSIGVAIDRLRSRRLGDTLVVLTGDSGESDITSIASLRGTYPSILVGVIGARTSHTSSDAGMLVIGAKDAASFASAWDEVRSW